MSYPGVDPSETIEANPAETQDVSGGVTVKPQIHSLENEIKTVEVEPPLSDEQIRLAAEKAAAEAIKHQFDVTEAWAPKKVVKFVIECSGGQKALVKHLGTNDLINQRLMEELDFFTKVLFSVATDHSAGSLFSSLDDPEKRLKFFDMTNRLISVACVKPKVINDGCALVSQSEYDAIIDGADQIPSPAGELMVIFGHQVKDLALQARLFGKIAPDLNPGETYAGAIDFSDRLAFYRELTKPLEVIEPFREGQNAVLAGMETVPSSELPPKSSL